MEIAGKIDRALFRGISESILTDEVVLTANRRQHIIERRGEDFYSRFRKYFCEILAEPDYIFKDKSPATALVSKAFPSERGNVNIILRLAAEEISPDYKNSIITVILENEDRFNQRLRNSVPVYKKT